VRQAPVSKYHCLTLCSFSESSQSRQDQNLLYLHDEPTKEEEPFCYVFRESPFDSQQGHNSLIVHMTLSQQQMNYWRSKNPFLRSSKAEIKSVCSRQIVPLNASAHLTILRSLLVRWSIISSTTPTIPCLHTSLQFYVPEAFMYYVLYMALLIYKLF
jgi:hypothetical protein